MKVWVIYIGLTVGAVIGALFCLDYLKRAYDTFWRKPPRRSHRILLLVLAIGGGALCLDIYGSGTVFLLYWFIPQAVMLCINFAVKRFMGPDYDKKGIVWKKVFSSGVIPMVIMVAIILYGRYTMHRIVATEYTIQTDKEIREDGYRVILLADVHYGTIHSKRELMEKCEEISRQDPDAVFLCGDIVDESTTKEKMEEVFEILSSIRSEYGTFYIFGNHDRQSYTTYPMYTEEELENVIERNGITILKDERYELNEEFVVVGREDCSVGGRKSMEELLSGADETDFIMTLDHQPTQFAENAEAGIDLHLSGHTHGGQIWPINYIKKMMYEGFYGYTVTEEGLQTVVTSGFAGWAMGIKTSAPAEYVVINIERSDNIVSGDEM